MKLAHCLIPILFAASSLIQNAYGTPEIGPMKCPVKGTCEKGALDNGYMDSRFLIKATEVPKDSRCPCCAQCLREAECFSLAFNELTRECRLYRAVAGYTTFLRSDDWKYTISGNSNTKSKHEEFCKEDSDCSAAGDACRGRICTNKKTVLCSTIYDVFMRGGASGRGLGDDIVDTYGWIDGKEKRIACTLNSLSPGYTVVFRNSINFKFDRKTIKRYNTHLVDGEVPYSDLDLAERLRELTTGGTYSLQVYSTLRGSTEPASLLQLEVPKRHPVIESKPRPASTHEVKISDLGCEKVRLDLVDTVSLPYLARVNGTHQGTGLSNKRNGLLSMHKIGAGWGTLGLAPADGAIHLFDGKRGECALLIHE